MNGESEFYGSIVGNNPDSDLDIDLDVSELPDLPDIDIALSPIPPTPVAAPPTPAPPTPAPPRGPPITITGIAIMASRSTIKNYLDAGREVDLVSLIMSNSRTLSILAQNLETGTPSDYEWKHPIPRSVGSLDENAEIGSGTLMWTVVNEIRDNPKFLDTVLAPILLNRDTPTMLRNVRSTLDPGAEEVMGPLEVSEPRVVKAESELIVLPVYRDGAWVAQQTQPRGTIEYQKMPESKQAGVIHRNRSYIVNKELVNLMTQLDEVETAFRVGIENMKCSKAECIKMVIQTIKDRDFIHDSIHHLLNSII